MQGLHLEHTHKYRQNDCKERHDELHRDKKQHGKRWRNVLILRLFVVVWFLFGLEHGTKVLKELGFLLLVLFHGNESQGSLFFGRIDLVFLAETDRIHAGVTGSRHDVTGFLKPFNLLSVVPNLSTARNAQILLHKGRNGLTLSRQQGLAIRTIVVATTGPSLLCRIRLRQWHGTHVIVIIVIVVVIVSLYSLFEIPSVAQIILIHDWVGDHNVLWCVVLVLGLFSGLVAAIVVVVVAAAAAIVAGRRRRGGGC